MASINPRIAAGALAAILAVAAPIIAYHEGYVPNTYADPIGIPTVCFGHTGPDVEWGQEYTRAQCDALLTGDTLKTVAGLDTCIRVDLQPNEWAALTSLAYNVGYRAVCRSTIVRMIHAGTPAAQWCQQFSRWIYAGGKVLPGLVKRRAAEQSMCLGGVE